MADNIVYELSLHDMFTQTMEKANQATEKMEGHLEKVNDLAKELVLSLGAGLAIFKGFEILKEGLGEFKKITIESAVLTNELKNQGKYSKQLVDNLKEGREQLENLGFFKEGDNFKFQQQLMKQFPGANDKYRELYTETAANLANGG